MDAKLIYRFCCYPRPEGQVYSESNYMLIIFRGYVGSDVGFKARVKLGKCFGIIWVKRGKGINIY